jgi:imidazole glycerol-phosphate synthase subunit HisF
VLKKRIIFTLLYDSGSFMLSRNFRLQKVGTIDWLQKNYDFSRIAFYIDELIVLDVSRAGRDMERFSDTLKILAKGCFAPIAAGGGIRKLNDARQLLRSGADKVVVNSALFNDPQFVKALAQEFGQQCVVAAVDIKHDLDGTYRVYTDNGSCGRHEPVHNLLEQLPERSVGELYLNSINQDGTGQGFDLRLLDQIPQQLNLPTILAGGAGHSQHLIDGLFDERVDAVATAHLFNFVGDGLKKARESIRVQDVDLANWTPLSELKLNLSVKGSAI